MTPPDPPPASPVSMAIAAEGETALYVPVVDAVNSLTYIDICIAAGTGSGGGGGGAGGPGGPGGRNP